MIGSLFTGVSGLNANTTAMSVIGDNIANSKTVGFKANRLFFSSLLSKALGGATSITGLGGGVQFWGSNALWTQGSLETTNSSTDLAVYGNGLFVVKDQSTGTSYFSRAGIFSFDKDGNLVNPDGYIVQGYEIHEDGSLGKIEDISVPTSNINPQATTELSLGMNVSPAIAASYTEGPVNYTAVTPGSDGNDISIEYKEGENGGDAVTVTGTTITVYLGELEDAEGNVPASAVVDAINEDDDAEELVLAAAPDDEELVVAGSLSLSGGKDAGDTNTSMTVYDSLGNAITLTFGFTYDEENKLWNVTVSSSDGNAQIDGGTSIEMTFDANGKLLTPEEDPQITLTDLSTGASDMTINWTFGDGMTGYVGSSVVNSQTQNGFPTGSLQNVYVDENGVVTGVYSNSQVKQFFHIALADFSNLWGLNKVGKSLYSETLSSGDAVYGIPGSGRLGNISPNSIEMSNTDIATEFVQMITTQRSFQANSKVIVTSDEILSDVINMKR